MENNVIYDSIRCKASEIGKIIVNKCLDKGIKINTIKLEKLLVLMYGTLLSEYKSKLFEENIICTENGVMIKEVDEDFIPYAIEFTNRFAEYICPLESEEEVIDYILKKYEKLNASQLNEVYPLKILKEISIKNKTNSILPSLIMKVFSYNYYSNESVDYNNLNNNYEEKQKYMSTKKLIKDKRNFMQI